MSDDLAKSANDSVLYQTIILTVSSSNPQSGDRIVVTLSSVDDVPVAWSTGKDFSSSAGISLNSSSSTSVPVSRFSITSSKVTFVLAPTSEGTSLQFTTQAFLAAQPSIRQFTLALTSDQGSSVSATIPGRNPYVLGENETIIPWNA